MRLNKFLAQATGMSRRAADAVISEGRVQVNGNPAATGLQVESTDVVLLDNNPVRVATDTTTLMLNKPIGYICSRNGQGNPTIYELLPDRYHSLKPIGRLDKHSSGLLLLTDDGDLAHKLTHPSFEKQKKYKVHLDHDLTEADFEAITKKGVMLDDGPSKFALDYINDSNRDWKVTMHEGRNRQIRRTFEELGYNVQKLHRTHFGAYTLKDLKPGTYKELYS